MADNSRLDSLREANLTLLSKLHTSQKAIWKDVNVIKSTAKTASGAKRINLAEFRGHGPDRTPVTLRKRYVDVTGNESEVHGRLFSTPRKEDMGKENRPASGAAERITSILRTPKSKRKSQVKTSKLLGPC